MPHEPGDPRAEVPLSASERRSEAERKEKVLHTRVPEALERELRQRARRNGISVSGVVRNVLVRTFGLVEDIVSDSAGIALAIAGHDLPDRPAVRAPEPDADAVLAWQVAILNLNAVCDACNAILPRGTRAGIGLLRDGARARAIRCSACLDALAEDAQGEATARAAAERANRNAPSPRETIGRSASSGPGTSHRRSGGGSRPRG